MYNLDRHISIYVKTLSQGVNGEETVASDAKLGTIDWWAAYNPESGGEVINDGMSLSVHDIEFVLRYNALTAGITEDSHYIIYNSKVYGIELVEFEGRQEWVKIKAVYKDINVEV